MIPRPPRSTRTDTLFPYTTLFRSYRSVTNCSCSFVMPLACAAFWNDWNSGSLVKDSKSTPSIGLPSASLGRSEEHTSEPVTNAHLVCRLLLEKKNKTHTTQTTVTKSQSHRNTFKNHNQRTNT